MKRTFADWIVPVACLFALQACGSSEENSATDTDGGTTTTTATGGTGSGGTSATGGGGAGGGATDGVIVCGPDPCTAVANCCTTDTNECGSDAQGECTTRDDLFSNFDDPDIDLDPSCPETPALFGGTMRAGCCMEGICGAEGSLASVCIPVTDEALPEKECRGGPSAFDSGAPAPVDSGSTAPVDSGTADSGDSGDAG